MLATIEGQRAPAGSYPSGRSAGLVDAAQSYFDPSGIRQSGVRVLGHHGRDAMIRTLVVIFCSLVGVGVAIHSRFGALLFYMWVAFFRPQDWVWVDIRWLRLSLISTVLLVVPSVLTFKWPNVTHRLSVGSIVFVTCLYVANHAAVEPEMAWFRLTGLATLVMVTTFLITLTDTQAKFVAVLAVISGSFAFFSAKAGLVSLMRGGTRFAEGMSGAFTDNNAYAIGTVMLLFPLIFVAQNVSVPAIRRAVWIAVPLSALTVVSTFSRAGFLALVASTLTFIMLQRRRGRLLTVSAMAAVLALLVAPIPEGYFDRIQTIQTYEEVNETSALSRLYFWRVALEMAADYPLGIGPWQFEARYDEYDVERIYGRRRAVHNSFLQALTEAGWLGGAVFALLFASSLLTLFRLRGRSRDQRHPPQLQRFLWTASNSLIASIVAFVVGGNFISMAYNDLTWISFGLVAALERLSWRADALLNGDLPQPARALVNESRRHVA